MKIQKKLLTLFAIVMAGIYSANAQGGTWQKYSPAGESFSVSIPCKPEVKTENDETTGKIKYTEHGCNDGAIFYLVQRVSRVKLADLKQEMDIFCKSVMTGANGKLVSQTDITMGKIPGRELIFTMMVNDREMTARSHFYFAGDNIFGASAGTFSAPAPPAEIVKFLDSFALDQ